MKSLQIPCLDYKLAADWYEGTNDDVLLVLPGYSSNKENCIEMVGDIVGRSGTSALVIDYGGHGESPFDLGDVSPAQNFLETTIAFDWMKSNHPNKKISVLGTSYGSYLATQLTKYRDFDNLVLRVPAIYKPEQFYDKWSIRHADEEAYRKEEDAFRKDEAALAKHPLLVRAANFKGKTLVVVHENDELVSKETTDAYIKAFQAAVYLAKGFPHNPKDAPEEDKIAFRQAIADFLNAS